MKKIILAALVVASLFASCSSEKTFKKKDGSTITAKPYGWASKENKVEGVNYELNAPDVRNRAVSSRWFGIKAMPVSVWSTSNFLFSTQQIL